METFVSHTNYSRIRKIRPFWLFRQDMVNFVAQKYIGDKLTQDQKTNLTSAVWCNLPCIRAFYKLEASHWKETLSREMLAPVAGKVKYIHLGERITIALTYCPNNAKFLQLRFEELVTEWRKKHHCWKSVESVTATWGTPSESPTQPINWGHWRTLEKKRARLAKKKFGHPKLATQVWQN